VKVLEPAVIGLRLVQYAGAAGLFGTALFAAFLPRPAPGTVADRLPWLRGLLFTGVLAVLAGSLLGLVAQTAVLTGSLAGALRQGALSAAITTMAFGSSSLIRAGAAVLALGFLAGRQLDAKQLWALVLLGGIVVASFSWMGHGAATPGKLGVLHLAADILHSLAASAWIGALVGFCGLLGASAKRFPDALLVPVLRGFSLMGMVLVVLIVSTGLVNTAVLMDLSHMSALWRTSYGQLLSAKLLLFTAMLALAALNRFRWTPSLEANPDAASVGGARKALRRSIITETVLAIGVLALVAWLGRTEPPA
jgi:putative copper resistance protein D